jgi:hypothetical protein
MIGLPVCFVLVLSGLPHHGFIPVTVSPAFQVLVDGKLLGLTARPSDAEEDLWSIAGVV